MFIEIETAGQICIEKYGTVEKMFSLSYFPVIHNNCHLLVDYIANNVDPNQALSEMLSYLDFSPEDSTPFTGLNYINPLRDKMILMQYTVYYKMYHFKWNLKNLIYGVETTTV